MEIEVVKDELLCKGRRIELYNRILNIDGKQINTDLVKFGESVVIVPLIADDEIIFLRQYRSSIDRWIFELPAGRVDEGEDKEAAAKRELIEETGYEASKFEYVGSFYVSPGYSDEYMHLYIASGLKYVGEKPEEDEVIRTETVKLSELEDMLYKDIVDGKSILGVLTLLWFKRWRVK